MSAVGQASQVAGSEGTDWLHQPEIGNAFWMRVMVWIALTCGRRVARWVLHPVTLYYVLFSPVQRRHSRRYLDRALGREAGWLDGYRHVHAFAATILDRVYLLRDEAASFDVQVRGTDLLDAMLDTGRGAFLIGAHMGSFEALRVVGRSRPERRIAMVMYLHNARRLYETLAAIAPEAKPEVIALGQRNSMLAIRDWLDANGLAGMLADRTLPPGDAMAAMGGREGSEVFDFLGHPAPFADGPFRLAALLKRPVLFMVGLYLGGARYDVRFETLADFSAGFANAAEREAAIREALAAYVGKLEILCREHPYNWFNFHDFWNEDAA